MWYINTRQIHRLWFFSEQSRLSTFYYVYQGWEVEDHDLQKSEEDVVPKRQNLYKSGRNGRGLVQEKPYQVKTKIIDKWTNDIEIS